MAFVQLTWISRNDPLCRLLMASIIPRAKGPSFTRWDNLIFIDSLLSSSSVSSSVPSHPQCCSLPYYDLRKCFLICQKLNAFIRFLSYLIITKITFLLKIFTLLHPLQNYIFCLSPSLSLHIPSPARCYK